MVIPIFRKMIAVIRKFGLEHCDMPTMIWNMSFFLRALTLNIDKRYKKRIPIICYIFSTTICICYFYVYVVSMLWFVFVKCRETGDVINAMVVFSLGLSSEIGTSKLICMFIYRDVVRNLVKGYLHCDSIIAPGSRYAKNILKTLKIIKKRALIFWMVIIGNGVVFCVKPLILPGRHLMDDSLILYGLEPMYESPNYELAYGIHLFAVAYSVYLPANITALLIVIVGYSEAQLNALSEEITHLWNDAEEHYSEMNTEAHDDNNFELKNKILNKYVKRELVVIAKRHAMNIDFLQKVEQVYRGAIGSEFALLIIALIAELLGGLENTYLQVPYALMQVAMDCLVGQRLIDASVVFENAVYDSKWENFDIANMKTVFVMLLNSQKTLTLSAGGITTLSFMTLMSVLKSIYSAFTTLRSTMD